MDIALGSDHAGYELKLKVRAYLLNLGHTVADFGTHTSDSMDYPDVAHPVASSVENKECETCCGFGGTFAIKYEPISIGMAQTKVKSAMDAGAEYIISTDISCLMHLEGYIKHEGLPIKTAHLADVLVQGW